MDHSFGKICAYVLSVTLMFLVPLRLMLTQKEQLNRLYIQMLVGEFADIMATTGKIDETVYRKYSRQLEPYEVQICINRSWYEPKRQLQEDCWEAEVRNIILSWERISACIQERSLLLYAKDVVTLAVFSPMEQKNQVYLEYSFIVRNGG